MRGKLEALFWIVVVAIVIALAWAIGLAAFVVAVCIFALCAVAYGLVTAFVEPWLDNPWRVA